MDDKKKIDDTTLEKVAGGSPYGLREKDWETDEVVNIDVHEQAALGTHGPIKR